MFDWEEFHRPAERTLAAAPDDEATQRTAINRAYYAMFNVAKAYPLKEGVAVPPTGVAHEVVWRAFQATPRGTQRKIAQVGFRLLRRRHEADYEPTYAGVGRDAARSVRRAKQGIEAIRGLVQR